MACLRPPGNSKKSRLGTYSADGGQDLQNGPTRDWRAGRGDRLRVQGEGQDQDLGRLSGTQDPAHIIQLGACYGAGGRPQRS